MWERLGYYGMRALLVLFMVDASANGGLGLTVESATAIYGLYTAAVYLAALPGGWVGDRMLGSRRAVWCGGFAIAAGYFTLALPRNDLFGPGLALVVIGTGLLKPNITSMVGGLYPEGGARRDAGFTVFYMGVNLGAALGPLVCSSLSRHFNWRYGFAAAGCGMLLGLAQYGLTGNTLGTVGQPQPKTNSAGRRDRMLLGCGIGAIAVMAALLFGGVLRFSSIAVAKLAATAILAITLIYFVLAFCAFGLEKSERKQLTVILVLFAASALFWAGFEQAGSSFNLFAQNHTRRLLDLPGFLGPVNQTFEIPAGWFLSLGAIFVIVFAPVMAALWLRLAKRGIDPSPGAKFGFGLLLLGAGFLAMTAASKLVQRGDLVAPWWLVATYLLHSLGELCVSPVGLSSVSRLAPSRLVGQMIGIWFLATSLGNLLAGLIAGQLKSEATADMPVRYGLICLGAIGAGVAMLFIGRKLNRLSQQKPRLSQ